MSNNKFEKRIDKLLDRVKISPKALISIIYGDMLVPHGGTVWLGSLVKLAGLFGVVEYLSRTSALRLVHDGWLHPTRIGKLSFYSMTEDHITRLKEHYPRVYGPPLKTWSGTWYLLLTGASGLSRKEVVDLRQSLRWHGVGQLAPDVFISAAETVDAIELILQELNLRDKAEVMRAESILPKDAILLRSLVKRAWDVDQISRLYEGFLKQFRPIRLAFDEGATLDPERSFILRVILISQYRSIVLQDPRLPKELLPEPWVGSQAFTLCKSLYQSLLVSSESYLREVVRTADGPIGQAGDLLYKRFNGLERSKEDGDLTP